MIFKRIIIVFTDHWICCEVVVHAYNIENSFADVNECTDTIIYNNIKLNNLEMTNETTG